MRWLPIGLGKQIDGVAILLPCPATDLIRLATECSDHDSGRLSRLLRRNPSLMLFVLSEYQRARGNPPGSAGVLIAWCQTNLICEIAGLDFSFRSDQSDAWSEQRCKKILEEFLRSRSNRELQRSLRRFLRLFYEADKSTIKSGIAQLVGKKLCSDQFKCKHMRRKSTWAQVTKEWSSRIGSDINVSRLFEFAELNLESTARFALRLQQEKLASMKQLAYGASHEINNPLANIATRAQTMLASESDPEKRHKLAVIYEQAMRAHEMISDMMLFAHPPALKTERVSLRLLMARIVHELTPVFESVPGIEFNVVIGGGISDVELDPLQFSVAIKNLVRNSIEALDCGNEQNPQIEVRIEQLETKELRVSIWDNGTGISDDVARHIFDPFYSGREAGRGLGFGLSKVWTIAKLHGGELRHDCSVVNGTRFVLTFAGTPGVVKNSSTTILTIHNRRQNAEEDVA